MSALRPSELRFVHRLIRELPGSKMEPTPSRQTPGIFFAEVDPTPVSDPRLLIWSSDAAALLDLSSELGSEDSRTAAEIFTGNRILAEARPYSTRYGGHQFGVWAGQLGDGRAIALGEVRNGRNEYWEVQLKGAGPTPYSRAADGRAVLRSSLREFLCSEALFHLGIPTTRALCCVTTGDVVIRDMFYDGNPRPEPGAITTRLAPSFLRFGHYEILAASGETELLRKLIEATIGTLFPELSPSEDLIVSFFSEVANRTMDLMVDWQRVGFVHGVMNTDNLSILGLTIDYGPYGWIDAHDPEWTPNTTDAERRRYCFGNQPSIALWNLSRLGSAFIPLFDEPKKVIPRLEQVLDSARQRFAHQYLHMRAAKLGFVFPKDHSVPDEIRKLLEQLDELLVTSETDMTLFYRLLSSPLDAPDQTDAVQLRDAIQPCFYLETLPPELDERWRLWLSSLSSLWRANPRGDRKAAMESVNPFFTLRNYLVQEALEALALENHEPMNRLMAALRTPYEKSAITEPYFRRRPEWAREKPGSSALSCSS